MQSFVESRGAPLRSVLALSGARDTHALTTSSPIRCSTVIGLPMSVVSHKPRKKSRKTSKMQKVRFLSLF